MGKISLIFFMVLTFYLVSQIFSELEQPKNFKQPRFFSRKMERKPSIENESSGEINFVEDANIDTGVTRTDATLGEVDDNVIGNINHVDRSSVVNITEDFRTAVEDNSDLDNMNPLPPHKDDSCNMTSLDKDKEIITKSLGRSDETTADTNDHASEARSLNNCSDVKIISCDKRCGEYISLPCSCDHFCLINKNCCPDYQDVCRQDTEMLQDQFSDLLNLEFTCIETETSKESDMGLQVIGGCRINASEESKQLCSSTKVKPVTLANTTLHFININCLICNDFKSDDVIHWNFQVIPKINKYESATNGQGLETFIRTEHVSATHTPPEGVDLVHCFTTVIDNCETGVKDELKDKCSSAHSMYLYNGDRYIKNLFCAECHLIGYPDNCITNVTPRIIYRFNYFLAIIIEIKPNNKLRVTSHGTRNIMPWLESQCTYLNDSITDVIDCNIVRCRTEIQMKDGMCDKKNKIQCFLIISKVWSMEHTSVVDNNQLIMAFSQAAEETALLLDVTNQPFNTSLKESGTVSEPNVVISMSPFNSQANYFKKSDIFMKTFSSCLKKALSASSFYGNVSVCFRVKQVCNINECSEYNLITIPKPRTAGTNQPLINPILIVTPLIMFLIF
ncbi:hypothetical protein SNE40_013793 [Patella caerulea]|uniref:SMB domain-containing protein n=1 Tax=Patella caerulea TaxID=87958 RepID=A0AAN8PG34_PATCE